MAETFIDKIAPFAVDYGTRGAILPALIIAQGILESNSGKSELAVNANNLFGIKKGVGWTGEVYAKSSKEFSEEKGWYDAVSEFRKYETFEGCVRDLVEFYQRDRYAKVVDERDFLSAATASHKAGYATDPTYPQKLYKIYLENNLEGYGMNDLIISADAGHGGFGVTPGKRGPDGKFEWVWNNASLIAFIAHITTTYNGVRVVRVDDPTGKTDVPLATRCSRSNAAGAHLHISFHMNAMSSSWTNNALGTETFIASGSASTSGAARLQNAIHADYVKAMGLKDRGKKQAPFYILLNTRCPAILLEGGFMDSKIDRNRMDNPNVIIASAHAVSDSVASLHKLGKKATAPKPSPIAQKWYRVRKSWADITGQVGAFIDSDEAVVMADSKKSQGFKVFDNDGKLFYDPNAKELFRVRKTWADAASQIGAFHDLQTAKDLADHNTEAGYEVYNEAGKVVHQPKLVPIPVVKPAPVANVSDEEDEYKDVPTSLLEEFIQAKELGFTDGSNPDKNTTRAETAVIALRVYLKAKEEQ